MLKVASALLALVAAAAPSLRVLDQQSQPVDGADVVVNGQWHLRSVDGGVVSPVVVELAVARNAGAWGQAHDGGDVRLEPTELVRGRVTNNHARAQSVFATPLDAPYSSLSTFEFESAADGTFEVSLSAGRWALISRFDSQPVIVRVGADGGSVILGRH